MSRQVRNPLGEREADPLFAVTRWSVVQRARDESTLALNDLFTQYREPLLIYLMARGQVRDRAEELKAGCPQKGAVCLPS